MWRLRRSRGKLGEETPNRVLYVEVPFCIVNQTDKYSNYVEHPRYGQGPRITGLNPQPHEAKLHWNATSHDEIMAQWERAFGKPYPYNHRSSLHRARPKRIPNTAIVADLTRQTPATIPVTHYFDLERVCRDCGRPFIFFAEEQRYWYEELGFGLDSDCVRCVECRKTQRGIAQLREAYESLSHVADKTVEQSLEMAEACLTLMESGVFTGKQTQRVRALLNAIPADADVRNRSRYTKLYERAAAIEQNNTGGGT